MGTACIAGLVHTMWHWKLRSARLENQTSWISCSPRDGIFSAKTGVQHERQLSLQLVAASSTSSLVCPPASIIFTLKNHFFTDRWWISSKLTSLLCREIGLSNWPITSWLLDGLAPGPWASTISTSSLWEMVETTNLWNNFSYMFDLLAACLQYQLISRNKVELHWIKWTACETKILGKNKNNRFQTFQHHPQWVRRLG